MAYRFRRGISPWDVSVLVAAALLAVAFVGCDRGNDSARATLEPEPSGAASVASPTAEATTERRVLIPPPGGTSTATFRGIPVLFRMAIVDFFGTERVVTDEAEIEAAVPWPIVLPSYLPPGYESIGLLRVEVPEDGLPPDAHARRIRVHIGFNTGPRGTGFGYVLHGGHVGTDGTEQVFVSGRPGEYGVNAQGANNLAWDLCGRTLVLGALEKDLPKDELIRIAESVPEQCE